LAKAHDVKRDAAAGGGLTKRHKPEWSQEKPVVGCVMHYDNGLEVNSEREKLFENPAGRSKGYALLVEHSKNRRLCVRTHRSKLCQTRPRGPGNNRACGHRRPQLRPRFFARARGGGAAGSRIASRAGEGFARIHRQNPINYGVLPLVFVDPEDYDRLHPGEVLHARDLRRASKSGQKLTLECSGAIAVKHDLTQRQADAILAGSLINWHRTQRAAS
jgi:hypothetical protein